MTQAQTSAELTQAYAAGALSWRNRIINGAQLIAQRGTSFTGAPNSYQTVDRFGCSIGSGSGHTVGQVLDGPVGFRTCFGVTIGTGAAPAAANFSGIWHNIEGYGVTDFGYGTSWARTGIFSFAVKSSIPGNYALSFMNGSLNRHYILPYTVSAANTWESKSIILPGDVAGTWDGGSGNGLSICWDLGSGSNYEDVLGGWSANQKYSTPASVKLVATSGAIFRVTGVQFELGTIVTPFEMRPIAAELALCQRYFWRHEVVPSSGFAASAMCYGAAAIHAQLRLPVSMRVSPTILGMNQVGAITASGGNVIANSFSPHSASPDMVAFNLTMASASFNPGDGTCLVGMSSPCRIDISAEL